MTRLARETRGHGTPLAFVHGFTQTRTSWEPLLGQMTTDVEAMLIDAPGHGESGEACSLEETAGLLCDAAAGRTLVGYSMGARMSLVAALECPAAFPRLVIISGTAGLESETERTERRDADARLADRIEQIGVAAFVDEWLANPMFAGLSAANARRSERLRNSAAGLAGSLRLAGTGTQTPLWDRLAGLSVPTLFVAGALDAKFCALAERMHSLVPGSELHVHPGVGHTVHLEDPVGCAAVIDDWLSRSQ